MRVGFCDYIIQIRFSTFPTPLWINHHHQGHAMNHVDNAVENNNISRPWQQHAPQIGSSKWTNDDATRRGCDYNNIKAQWELSSFRAQSENNGNFILFIQGIFHHYFTYHEYRVYPSSHHTTSTFLHKPFTIRTIPIEPHPQEPPE